MGGNKLSWLPFIVLIERERDNNGGVIPIYEAMIAKKLLSL